MAIAGNVYERQERLIALVEVLDVGNYKFVEVSKNGSLYIKFPLPSNVDTNEIELRTANIINQSGLCENPVRVKVTEAP